MPDIATLIGLIMFAFSGNADITVAATPCMTAAEDACLQSTYCDVFEDNGVSTCELACDARGNEESCDANTACAWVSGSCTYNDVSTVPEC